MRVAYKFHISSISPQDPLLFIGLYIRLCLLPLSSTHCRGHTQHIALYKESFSHDADMHTQRNSIAHTVCLHSQHKSGVECVELQHVVWLKMQFRCVAFPDSLQRFVFHWRNQSLLRLSLGFPLLSQKGEEHAPSPYIWKASF